MTNIDIVEAVEYYTTPRGQSVNSPNKLNFTSMGSVIGFDAFHLADTLLTHPQIIVGSKQGAFGSYKDGHELYEKASEKRFTCCGRCESLRFIRPTVTSKNCS